MEEFTARISVVDDEISTELGTRSFVEQVYPGDCFDLVDTFLVGVRYEVLSAQGTQVVAPAVQDKINSVIVREVSSEFRGRRVVAVSTPVSLRVHPV